MDNSTTPNSVLQKIRAFPKAVFRKHPILSVFGIIILLSYLFFFWDRIFITIHSGERGILFSRFKGGTDMNTIYTEGVHVLLPWNIMYIYDLRIQDEPQEVKALTSDGLLIDVQISLKYQLVTEELPTIHQTIGPEYKRKIIYPLITSAVRQAISNYRPDELYSTASLELQDFIMVNAVEEMGRIPIRIHSFVVRNIVLPHPVMVAIQSKLVAEQDFLRYKFILLEEQEEAKRRGIEAQGIRTYQEIINSNMTENYLRYEGIKATEKLAASPNAKLVIVGGKDGMPLILNPQEMAPAPQAQPATAPKGASSNTTIQLPVPNSLGERSSLQPIDPMPAGGEARLQEAETHPPYAKSPWWGNAQEKLGTFDRSLLYPNRASQ